MHLLIALALLVIVNEGPIIDPNGGHHTRAVHRDNGSCIDPDGRCVSAFGGDRGAGLDPNG